MVRTAPFTSSGTQPAASSTNRRSTLVFTLFTFWPPGPPEREKASSTSSVGGRREMAKSERGGASK